MMATNLLKTYHLHHHQLPLPKKNFVTYAVYALIAVALLYLFVDPAAPPAPPPPATASPPPLSTSPSPFPYNHHHQAGRQSAGVNVVNAAATAAETSSQIITTSTTTTAAATAAAPPAAGQQCDYADGEWVRDARPPPYNGTTCGAIKDDGRSCTLNGRSDTDYVHWRWQPRRCSLPDFSAAAFLRWLLRGNRHVAFVGDSLARNQAESLVCLLSAAASPELVHRSADGRFRRWVFGGGEHNGGGGEGSVSIFWSPFLVRGVEKSERDGVRYNQVFLDAFDERWMSELAAVDAVVLSAGHWFRIPTVYHDGGRVVGCHGCGNDDDEFNGTAAGVAEISFFSAFRDAVGRTLAEAARRHHHHEQSAAAAAAGVKKKRSKLVAMTTFSPSHFEGQWNEGAPCKKKADVTAELGYTETEMRKIVVEEVEKAAASASASASASVAAASLRFAAVDVTALANQRPDGHPGPYMRKNPFAAAGNTSRVQHDCLHWCMPGPVDTFNQILLQTILRH